MPIDKWYLMGLKSSYLRRHAHRTAGALHRLPEDRLVHFNAACEDDDMPEKITDLAKMMIDDGFPEWEFILKDVAAGITTHVRSSLAADWTKLRCLRHAAEQTGETAIHIAQSQFINTNFWDIEKIADAIPNLKMASIIPYGKGGYKDGDFEWLVGALEDTNIIVENLLEIKVNHIYKNFGLRADGGARLFTAEGAREHLEMRREQPRWDAGTCTYHFTRKYGILDGYYHIETSPPILKGLSPHIRGYQDVTRKDRERDTSNQRYLLQILNELRGSLIQVYDDDVDKLTNAIISARRIFVMGAGRSGLAMRAFAMRLMHLGFDTYVVGETITPSITSSDLLLIGSGSGATSSCVANAKEADAIGATICLITIDKESPIGQMADVILAISAPSPKIDKKLDFNSIQPMSSLFEQSLFLMLDAIVMLLMDKTGERHSNNDRTTCKSTIDIDYDRQMVLYQSQLKNRQTLCHADHLRGVASACKKTRANPCSN